MIMNIAGHLNLTQLISLYLLINDISRSHAAGVISTAMISILVEVLSYIFYYTKYCCRDCSIAKSFKETVY